METHGLWKYLKISAVSFALLFSVLFIVLFAHWRTDAAIAAWVQAFFSIVAIASAIGLSVAQADRDQRREVERERVALVRRLEAVLAICENARYVLTEVSNRRSDKNYLDQLPKRNPEIAQLTDAKTALDGIPLYDTYPWSVAATILSLSRVVGDAREAIVNTPLLVVSWAADRAKSFHDKASFAEESCKSVAEALLQRDPSSTVMLEIGAHTQLLAPSTADQTLPNHTYRSSAVDADKKPPVPIYVEFSDATERDIVSVFGVAQDAGTHPMMRTIDSSDFRYHAWYDALPDFNKGGQTSPT